MYMHVCMTVLFAVDISEMTITPSVSGIGTAGEMFTLNCSANITPNPLPEDVPPPSFEWFYGPINTSLPSGVTVSDVTNSGNTYTSTLQFSPLLVSHAGMYTCRLGGNERLAVDTNVTVDGMQLISHKLFTFVFSLSF